MTTFQEKMKASMEEFYEFTQNLQKGINNLAEIEEIQIATSEKEEVFSEGKRKLYHYKALKRKAKTAPVLIIYAMVNRYTMLDLQEDRSLIRNLLSQGLDVYLIDWGYADRADRYLTMEDLIAGFINDTVDFMRDKHELEKINLMGICQGGTFSTIYAALFPNKIQNLITTVTPIDFDSDEGLLNLWSRDIDVDAMIDYYGNIPGSVMNKSYLMLQPFMLQFQKYLDLVDIMGDRKKLENFLRMELWVFDSPDQPAEVLRQYLKDLYQKNLLVKGEFRLGRRFVDLEQVTMPLLVIYAEFDTLVPPPSSKALVDLVGSKDVETMSFPVGHIGMYVSGKTQKTLAPSIAKWLLQHT